MIPISVAFSKNHSIRSLLFVGAIAIWRFDLAFLWKIVAVFVASVFLVSSTVISPFHSSPFPLVTVIASPVFFRNTLEMCLLSSVENFISVVDSKRFS